MIADDEEDRGSFNYHELPVHESDKLFCAYCWREFEPGDVAFAAKEVKLFFCPENEGTMCIWNWATKTNIGLNFKAVKFMPR